MPYSVNATSIALYSQFTRGRYLRAQTGLSQGVIRGVGTLNFLTGRSR